MGERAKTWLGFALLFATAVSAGVDQWSNGKYPAPALLFDLAKVAIPALLVADGLSEAGRMLSNRRDRNDPPTTTPVRPDGDKP